MTDNTSPEAREAALESLVYVPGVFRCAKCNFTLIQSNLNASDGTVTARDAPGDKCPNDGSPLWRVSWKDWATENEQGWERLLAEKDEKIAQLEQSQEHAPDVVEAECARLLAAYLRKEIGRLMHQAEHWAENDKPLAVHHRLMKADDYFQILDLMERDPAKGWKLPFDEIRAELARPDINEPGTYPPSAELHRYRDPAFVSALASQQPPASEVEEVARALCYWDGPEECGCIKDGQCSKDMEPTNIWWRAAEIALSARPALRTKPDTTLRAENEALVEAACRAFGAVISLKGWGDAPIGCIDDADFEDAMKAAIAAHRERQ